MNKALLLGLVVVVSVAMIGGFMVVGGPGYARMEKQDAKRARDLQDLFRYLECRSEDKVLPQTLDDEEYCPTTVVLSSTADPVTGDPYAYRRLDDRHFEVCATFATEAQKDKRGYPYNSLKFEGQTGCRRGVVLASKTSLKPMDKFTVEPIE